MKSKKLILPAMLSASALMLGACSSDSNNNPNANADASDPLYLISGILQSPEGSTTYAYVTDDLTANREVDLANALTVEGTSSLGVAASPVLNGEFMVALFEEPTVIKYTTDDNGAISELDRIGFANEGLTTAQGAIVPLWWISETKAYLVDFATFKVVIFDPSIMEITGSFSIDGFQHDGEGIAPASALSFFDDGKVYLTARYFGPEITNQASGAVVESRVAVIDTADDSVTFDTQTECANLLFGHETDDAFYFTPHPNQPRWWYAGETENAPCIVRILKGTSEFDDSYKLDIPETFGTPIAGFGSGPGGISYASFWEESIGGAFADAGSRAYLMPAWQQYAVNLDTKTELGSISGLPVAAGITSGFTVEVDGVEKFFVGALSADFSGTTFYDATEPFSIVEAIEFPGLAAGLDRIR